MHKMSDQERKGSVRSWQNARNVRVPCMYHDTQVLSSEDTMREGVDPSLPWVLGIKLWSPYSRYAHTFTR